MAMPKKKKPVGFLFKEMGGPKFYNWWEYRSWNEMERNKIDWFLMPVQAKVKLTDNIYTNMRRTALKMGIFVHPAFKEDPDYHIRDSTFNPELGPPLTAPEPLPEDVILSNLTI